jgi:hypothetical protein
MSSDPIVIAVDITENFRSRFFDRFKNADFDQLGFESGKEARRLKHYRNDCLKPSSIAEIRKYTANGEIRLPRTASRDPYE